MKNEQHAAEIAEKQRRFATYLANHPERQAAAFERMKPEVREKMRPLVRDAWAKRVAGWETVVKNLYLHKLRSQNHKEYADLLPLVVAHEAAAAGVRPC